MQNIHRKLHSLSFKLPFIEFACFKQGLKDAIKLYLNGGSEIHDFIFGLHFCLTVFRLNIFPKSNEENLNQPIQSCSNFTDLLELLMRERTLMNLVAVDYLAYFKKSHPCLSNLQITAEKPSNFFERLLSNMLNTEDDATTVLKTKIYYQFEHMFAANCFQFS